MSDYLLASPEEMARLQLQAKVWEAESQRLLDRIGLQPGWSCLDLGCGAMGILGALSHLVGERGRVVGLDAEKSHLQVAQSYVQDEGLTNVELIAGDVHQTELPPESFDFVHERWVLPYVRVDDVLQEMIALTKPGGIVAVEESDQYSYNYFPEIPTWPRLKDILEAAFRLRGGDVNVGRHVYGLLRAAGLEDVQVRAEVVALQNSHPYMRLPMIAMGAMRTHLVNAGVSTDDELDALLHDLETCISDPDSYAVMFTLIQVWGRKPA